MMYQFPGLEVIVHPLAVRRWVEFKIERLSVKKRRRNYRVLRQERSEPCCYRAGSTLYIHPSLYAQLKERTHG